MILVTGGAGYIGSHTLIELLQAGKQVVVIDNFSNSDPRVFGRIKDITGKAPVFWVRGDIRDAQLLDSLFRAFPVTQVIHFAGLKAVGESVAFPERYYDCNVMGTLTLLRAMANHGVKELVFSSSATVYGEAEVMPIDESAPLQPTNPYGETKAAVEVLLRNRVTLDPTWKVACLRYFNPAGAHESGLIGENPQGIPNNLVPYICQVATGERSHLAVFGDDYPTPDGTGVRDYIHVVDLARGHIAALQWLEQQKPGSWEAFNLGTGEGVSVLGMLEAFEVAAGKQIPMRVQARRPGDVPVCLANPAKANEKLGWKAHRSVEAISQDAWRWAGGKLSAR